MPGKGAKRRGKARLQRGQCNTLAALFFLLSAAPNHMDGSSLFSILIQVL